MGSSVNGWLVAYLCISLAIMLDLCHLRMRDGDAEVGGKNVTDDELASS